MTVFLYRQPSPRGEGAPKGRIGHWRYEREWGKRLECVAYESNRAPTFKLRGSTGSEGSKGSKGSGGGFAANIYGAMPEGWRIEVRCLMSLSPIPNP